MPNCHHYHLRYNLNLIAQLSSCSDCKVQQTGLAQKDSPVVALIAMALIATKDFHRVLSKRIGEIVNSCIDDLEINAHTIKGDMLCICSKKVCLTIVCKAVEAIFTVVI